MSKKKKIEQEEQAIYDELAEFAGGEVLGKQNSVKYLVDTGSLALNYVCSGKFIEGGIPGGRITEIFGEESSSKSLVGTNVLYGCQKLGGYAIILDCENTMNKEFAQNASHLNVNKVLIYHPASLERAFKKIHTVVNFIRERDKNAPIVVVYDSITVSPCERELREIDLAEEYSEAEFKRVVGAKEQPGERAKVCSRELRKITPFLHENNVTLLVINQTRSKIGVMFGDPTTTGGGGKALPFYASLRLKTAAAKNIVRKIEGTKLETPIGVNINVTNKKNKIFTPYIGTKGLQLFFNNGMNPVTGLLTLLLQCKRVLPAGTGRFSVAPEYLPEGMEEYKFQSSIDRNDVPSKVLTDCPKLVDANTSDEVCSYLNTFGDAISQSSAEDIFENNLDADAEE